MSILIKSRNMPENCQECVCLNDEYLYCQAVGRKPSDDNLTNTRPDWCPLVEIPLSDITEQKCGCKYKCYYCGQTISLESDVSFEDVGIEGDGVVSYYSCPNCNTWYEIYVPTGIKTNGGNE